jgi:hypothetical protein
MKKILVISLLILSAFQAGFGQLDDDEIGNLRKHIKISDKDIVRINESAGLDSDNTLRVYLAIDRKGDERKSFEKWIKEWNKKDSGQYGKLEQTDDISQADVILVQFVTTRAKRVGETRVGVKNIPLSGQSQPKKMKVGAGTDYVSLQLPVYSYLLKREDNMWTVLYGSVETSINGEQMFNPETDLWKAYSKKRKEL